MRSWAIGLGIVASLATAEAAAQSISVVNNSATPVNVVLFGQLTGVPTECGRLSVLMPNQTGSFSDQSSVQCGPTRSMDVDVHRPGSAAGAPTTCFLTGVTWGRTVTITGTATAITCVVG
jgi:hypothetical protein